MTLDIRKSQAATQDALDAANALIGDAGTIEVYSTANPTSCDTDQTSTSLGSFGLQIPPFGAAFDASGRSEADATQTIDTANPTGAGIVIAWRIFNNDGTPVCVYQGDAGEGTGVDSLEFDDNDFQAGGTATVSSFKLYLNE
jgi:hypothetical protein